MGLQNWIGRLLAKVVRMAHEENAPPLTALVVRSDSGMVGEGYDEVLTVAGESSIENEVDREDHAASARFSCYQHFGAVIPGGAKPMLARNYVEHLSRKRKSADVPVVEVCKTCFLELPASGDCSNCA